MSEQDRHPAPAAPEPPADDASGGGREQFADPAGRHLAAALRTSFRLLGAIMALAAVAFLAMSFEFVEPGEVAIRTVFGEVVGTTPKGLAYNWPAPIGRIETVKVGERKIRVEDFWMNETPKDKQQADLRKRDAPRGGLRPGWDGALLTGDRNLLHMRIECTYAVARPGALGGKVEPVLLFRQNVADAGETMRSVLCAAAIRAAASRTADGLVRTEQARFESDVRQLTQARLDALRTGLEVRTVKVIKSIWPLRTLPDYDAAQRAVAEAEEARNAALGDAVRDLNEAAGPAAARKLVGRPSDVVAARGQTPTTRPAGAEADGLIGRYAAAVRRGDPQGAAELLEPIDSVLVSESTGQASRALGLARRRSTQTIQSVQRRVQRFNELLPEYLRAPQFMIQRLWDEVREQILSSPTVEKHYVPTGKNKTILRINRDPEMIRQIRGELLRKKPSQDEQPR